MNITYDFHIVWWGESIPLWFQFLLEYLMSGAQGNFYHLLWPSCKRAGLGAQTPIPSQAFPGQSLRAGRGEGRIVWVWPWTGMGYSKPPQTTYHLGNFLVGLDWVWPDHTAKVSRLNVFVFKGVSSLAISFAGRLTVREALGSKNKWSRAILTKLCMQEHVDFTFENLPWLTSKGKVRHGRSILTIDFSSNYDQLQYQLWI